jgi:hypothetical protein
LAFTADADDFLIHRYPIPDFGQRLGLVGSDGGIEEGPSVGLTEWATVVQAVKFSFGTDLETGFALGRGDAVALIVA